MLSPSNRPSKKSKTIFRQINYAAKHRKATVFLRCAAYAWKLNAGCRTDGHTRFNRTAYHWQRWMRLAFYCSDKPQRNEKPKLIIPPNFFTDLSSCSRFRNSFAVLVVRLISSFCIYAYCSIVANLQPRATGEIQKPVFIFTFFSLPRRSARRNWPDSLNTNASLFSSFEWLNIYLRVASAPHAHSNHLAAHFTFSFFGRCVFCTSSPSVRFLPCERKERSRFLTHFIRDDRYE